MPRLIMGQRLILQEILKAQGESPDFIEDARIAQVTRVPLKDVRNYLLTLDHIELVDLALAENGIKASITPTGRLALGLFGPFPGQPAAPAAPRPSRSRGKTGRERALVVGISDYPPPIRSLPAVANDVREIAGLLRSENGQFPGQNVAELVGQAAQGGDVLRAVDAAFGGVTADDSVFVYMAGHGAVVKDDYFFVAHDTNPDQMATTGVPLRKIKEAFEGSPSQRAFLWLDFCHSGGILARDVVAGADDGQVIDRTLKVVRGEGKLIMAACTPTQLAYEADHGLFTGALLRGLKGAAANDKEVTVNSLFDYIDRQIGNDRQRPMMYGQMTGRVVLMQYA